MFLNARLQLLLKLQAKVSFPKKVSVFQSSLVNSLRILFIICKSDSYFLCSLCLMIRLITFVKVLPELTTTLSIQEQNNNSIVIL